MNPPIHESSDREALLEALTDGTIDMIATDHAPHSEEEKSRGFSRSLNGIVGLESAFPVLYTVLVRGGVLPLEALVSLMSSKPRARFSLGDPAKQFLWDLETPRILDPAEFQSKSRSCPFSGWKVYGRRL